MNNTHITVMLTDAVEALQIKSGQWYIDGTFGRGGHTQEILNAGGNVIAFDFDKQAIEYGQEKFADEIKNGQLILIRENFSHLADTVLTFKEKHSISKISGILFDFGTSTEQLTSKERGFSFEGDGPLDMRMDQRLGVQAKDLLAIIPEKQLAELFSVMGGERDAKRIARAIKKSPEPITTIEQLRKVILQNKHVKKNQKIHPATKVFQALRIAVNTELDNIIEMIPQALNLLENNGRIVTIAFHEGEDRIIKHTFKNWESRNLGYLTTKKPLSPSDAEQEKNPRSRSAKMRVFVKGTNEN